MAALYRIFLLVSVALASAAPRSLRPKRSLMDLAHLFDCSLTENVSSYIIYGCYCGPGGEGQPMDEADRCCFLHDCCYGKVEGDCEPKLKGYNWTCKKKSAECEDSEDTCERKVCECDRALVECLKTKPYNGTNFGQRLLGLCGDKKPACL